MLDIISSPVVKNQCTKEKYAMPADIEESLLPPRPTSALSPGLERSDSNVKEATIALVAHKRSVNVGKSASRRTKCGILSPQ